MLFTKIILERCPKCEHQTLNKKNDWSCTETFDCLTCGVTWYYKPALYFSQPVSEKTLKNKGEVSDVSRR